MQCRGFDCLFCRIIAGEIAAQIVDADELVVAFKDISPVSPTHVLVVPRQHLRSAAELDESHGPLLIAMMAMAKKIVQADSLEDYRLVVNNGAEAGQSVFHLHLHVLGGRTMSWPPG